MDRPDDLAALAASLPESARTALLAAYYRGVADALQAAARPARAPLPDDLPALLRRQAD